MKCIICGKEIELIEGKIFKKLRRQLNEYCSIDCRRVKKLSSKKDRERPIKTQKPDYNNANYEATKRRIKKQHKKLGHLVNVHFQK